MDRNTKTDVIAELAGAFFPEQETSIDTSKFIISTNTLDCTAFGLDIETLEKTCKVIEWQEEKIKNNMNKSNEILLAHLRVAKKCVEEIMSQKIALEKNKTR